MVSKSSARVEFHAMAHGICEGVWIKRLLEELGVMTKGSIKLFCDNQSAISIAKNPAYHDRTKHVEINRHLMRK